MNYGMWPDPTSLFSLVRGLREKMILEEETFQKFGYYPSELKPKSEKRILAQCNGCGKIREVRKGDYHALCISCAQKGKHLSEDTRRKMSEVNKGEKHPLYGTHHSEETKRKIGGAQKGEKHWNYGKHHSEETKRKIGDAQKGEKAHNWQGGISFLPYCSKWNEDLKEHIREKFSRKCFLCPRTEKENGRKLSVHHVNYGKDCLCDGSLCQFVPLCMSCHMKTNYNREHWENIIATKLKNYIVGYYI